MRLRLAASIVLLPPGRALAAAGDVVRSFAVPAGADSPSGLGRDGESPWPR